MILGHPVACILYLVLTLISILTLAVIRCQPLSVHWRDIIAGGVILTPVILTFIYVELNTRKAFSISR